MKLSEAVNRVIDLARKVREYYDAELPKRHPNYPLVGPGEEEPQPPPEEAALREFLAALPDEMLYQLLLIQYLCREDVGTDGLSGYYEHLKEVSGAPADVVSQMMMDKAILADELSDGLEEFSKRKINVDKLAAA